jgi:hypothetical protein
MVLEMPSSPLSRLHETLGTLTLKERDDIETKFNKALGTIHCFLDSTCKKIGRGNLTAKTYLLILLYTNELKELYLEVDNYVKSIVLKIKQVLLNLCSSKRMQAEDKHKPLASSLETIQRFIPSNLIQITTGFEPKCCLCHAGTRKKKSSPNWEEL